MNVVRESPTLRSRSRNGRRQSMHTPLRFTPYLRPMVWGGRRLAKDLGKVLPTNDLYGESWEVSDHPLHRSIVTAGPATGQSLRQLMETERQPLLGPAAARHAVFPWLVKFLDARDWLSVQVHPDDEAVRTLWPGEAGKTEAWFVLDAKPGSKIFAGLLPEVDEPALRAALTAGTIAECLHAFEPRPGDCLFLPAGTVHAVGGGVLLAEVQQTSDATFRLFDWNRRDSQGKSRKLHVEEALASIDWPRGPVQPVRVPGFSMTASGNLPEPARQALVACKYFHLEYVCSTAPHAWGDAEQVQTAIILRGHAQLAGAGNEEPIEKGQTWLLPAAMPGVTCRPDPELLYLLCTLPV